MADHNSANNTDCDGWTKKAQEKFYGSKVNLEDSATGGIQVAKKRGPKPKPRKDRKTEHLHVTLTEGEKARIVKYARSLSKKPTSWARETLLEAIEE